MSGFSIDWLDMREAADRKARDRNLLQRAWQWLASAPIGTGNMVVTDLGAGTGSTLRTFEAARQPQFPAAAALTWRLVDLDATLLAEAGQRHGKSHSLEVRVADLAAVQDLPLQGSRLVTASALFDLVSADFVDTLATVLHQQNQRQPVGLYSALNYDGTTRWTPVHPLDNEVLAAFNRDQQRDKGLGPALGPAAGRYTEEAFTEAGFVVHTASSPWQLDGADNALVSALIEGIAMAVAADPAIDRQALAAWQEFRQMNVRSGTCEVGHTDLLVLPGR